MPFRIEEKCLARIAWWTALFFIPLFFMPTPFAYSEEVYSVPKMAASSLLVGIFVLGAVLDRRPFRRGIGTGWILAAFLGIAGSSLFSISSPVAIRTGFFLGLLWMLPLLLPRVIGSRKMLRVSMWVLIGATGLAMTYGLLQTLDQEPFLRKYAIREPFLTGGTLGSSEITALFAVALIPVAVYLLGRLRITAAQEITALFLAVSAATILASGSYPAAWMGLGTVLICLAGNLWLLRHDFRAGRWSLRTVVAPAVLALLSILFLIQGLRRPSVETGFEEQQARTRLLRGTWDAFGANWFTGVGPGNWPMTIQRHYHHVYSGTATAGEIRPVHLEAPADFPRLGTELGFLGLLGFFGLPIWAAWKILRASKRDTDPEGEMGAWAALSPVLAMLVASFFWTPLRSPSTAFLYLALLAIGVTAMRLPKRILPTAEAPSRPVYRRIFELAVLILLFGAVGLISVRYLVANRFLMRGLKLSPWVQATAAFEAAMEVAPNEPRILLESLTHNLKSMNIERAQNNPKEHNRLLEQNFRLAGQVVRTNPNDPVALYRAGTLYDMNLMPNLREPHEKQQFRTPEIELRKWLRLLVFEGAHELSPSTATFLTGLGKAYISLGMEAEAAQSYAKALEIDPEDPFALLGLGTQVRFHFPEHAADLLTRALRPGSSLSPQGQALAKRYLQELGRDVEQKRDHRFLARILQNYQEQIRRNPRDSQNYLNAGLAAEEMGDLDLAQAYYKAAYRLNPEAGIAAARKLQGMGVSLEQLLRRPIEGFLEIEPSTP